MINNSGLNEDKRVNKIKLKNNKLKNSFPGEFLSNWQLYIIYWAVRVQITSS
mgnify:CR=1 FL=1